MGNLIATLKNIIRNPKCDSSLSEHWALSNAEYAIEDGKSCIKLYPNTTGMSLQYVESDPVVGHSYYGRITYKYNGSDPADYRYEWFAGDDGTNLIFSYKHNTNGVWITESNIQYKSPSNNSTYIRNFMVNASDYCYVTDMMIIDLSESFGLGNEPTQSWCDQNIPFFTDITYASYTDTYVKVDGVWKQATCIWVKKDGNWIELNNPIQNGVSNIYKKVNGVWVNTI